MISQEKVANYYQHLTPSYFSYASGSYGWHYGVWDSGVKSFSESLLQSNKRLVDGLDLNTNTQILDVGSGIGGFAVWVAKNFGCSVTGITLCESHIILSETLAALNQVLPQCKFQMMDMNEMSFEDNRFDLIINQETFCYAIDKKNFLSEVHRVLKPGGYWRSADFAVQELPLTPKENRKLKIVLDGFHIPSL
ncbi:MAG: class I SAM-dependent methyltransferase, partial [Chlamydiae bacterium]|nr:class I SAM-dependent methyltransferase [Chlamydiota bacterium]MBI3276402.1 class I SAM-dependent methyltransferase [Chlamydiota bacterium]